MVGKTGSDFSITIRMVPSGRLISGS